MEQAGDAAAGMFLVAVSGLRSTLRMTHDPLPPPRRAASVRIRTPARLHLGMVSFGVPGERAFGGVGVMIDRPGVHLTITRTPVAGQAAAAAGAARITGAGPQAERAVFFAESCAAAWGLAAAACRIESIAVPAGHAGLGSGTQLALAVAAGMQALFGAARAEVSEPRRFTAAEAVMLARAVGRGRRSCVGVYGFSGGGLVVEGGRLVPAEGSTDDAHRGFSPLLARVTLPPEWRCVVFGLRDVVGLHGDAEKQAFATLPPVPRDVSAELARIALVSLLPAAVDGHFAEFAEAVFAYGRLAGKPFEQASAALPYASSTSRLIDTLRGWGVRGCGQSSWGPTVLACCRSQGEADALVSQFATTDLAGRYDAAVARFDTAGAVLTTEDAAADQARATGSP